MKDARFKELLNLHLDHRLSPADAEELETALRSDPARRKALRDYEAMQSACAALFERSESRAPSSVALLRSLRQAEARIDHPRTFQDGWRWQTWGLTGGLAACVALVVARITQPALTAKHGEQVEETVPAGGAVLMAASVGETAVATGTALRRQPSPGNLAFAALGLSPGSANADAASRWILQTEEAPLFSTIEEANAAGAALVEWRPSADSYPAAASATHFHNRPITVWTVSAPSASGFQAQATGFRFER